MTEDTAKRKGVRHGYFLSPLLFNLHSEAEFIEPLEDTNTGITINGTKISNLCYAGVTVVIVSNFQAYRSRWTLFFKPGKRYGLFVNVDKTELLVFSKRPP